MTADANTCISCGMPMRAAAEHCLGDVSKPFCKYCGGPDGNLKSYDDVLAGMTAFVVRTQGLDEKVAREASIAMMAKQPAWRDR